MKSIDLNKQQLYSIAEANPEWVVKNRIYWMVANRPDYMAAHYPTIIAYIRPKWLFEHSPDYMARNFPQWVIKNFPEYMKEYYFATYSTYTNATDIEVPARIMNLLEGDIQS
jgi:hypothetical protein